MSTRRLPAHRYTPALCTLFLLAASTACGSAGALARHISSGCTERKRIALTFDDGPNPPYTGRVLDLLTSRGARATFFDEGESSEVHPDLVRREADAGMAVGSHSYSHSDRLDQYGTEKFRTDLVSAEHALTVALGTRPVMYRAPYGHTSKTMLRELRSGGYVSIGWDIDSKDWSDAGANDVVENVISHAHAGGIVLMHDGGLGGGDPDRSTTLDALPAIIDGLQGDGYELVTVPELIGLSAGNGTAVASCSAS